MKPEETAAMEGDLAEFPLLEMMSWLHYAGKTAVMRVEPIGGRRDQHAPGWLHFRKGNLCRCDWGSLHGFEAVVELAVARHGTFRLSNRPTAEPPPNIVQSTGKVLLDCAIILDEQSVT